MRICLIDDKLYGPNNLDGYKDQSKIKDELLEKYRENFEFCEKFFPACFGTGEKNGQVLESEILPVLDKYDIIIYHASSFPQAVPFVEIINERGKKTELIGFSGSIRGTKDYHPNFNWIQLDRELLYDRLATFVKDAMEKKILNLKLILTD